MTATRTTGTKEHIGPPTMRHARAPIMTTGRQAREKNGTNGAEMVEDMEDRRLLPHAHLLLLDLFLQNDLLRDVHLRWLPWRTPRWQKERTLTE